MKLKANIKSVSVVAGSCHSDAIIFFMHDEESQEILKDNTSFGGFTFNVETPQGMHQDFLRHFGVEMYTLINTSNGERKKVRLVERKQDG